MLDIDLPKIQLDDFTIPGTKTKSLASEFPAYSPDSLAKMVISRCQESIEARSS